MTRDKGHVERQFGSINSLFCQWLPGYTGSDVTRRGPDTEKDACYSVAQLQDLLDEWLVHYHHRPHEGLRHPMMPKKALTPNQMWAALVAVAGYVPVPLTGRDYLELLPVRWQTITASGIRIHHRTYDAPCLNGYRGEKSQVASRGGLWEVHHNPYDLTRIWVRLADGFQEVPWIFATQVSQPFTHHLWEHLCKVIKRAGPREEHEEKLALALDDLLKRASRSKKLTRRERRAVALSRVAGAVPVPASELDVLSAPTLSFGLAGVYTAPELDDESVPDEDDALLAPLDEALAPEERADGSSVLNDTGTGDGLWLP